MKQRKDIFNDSSLSNQTAILTLLTAPKQSMEKHVIPGGKELTSIMSSKEMLTNAIYTWLRSKAEFTEFYFSFAKEPEKYIGAEVKEEFFNKTDGKPTWHIGQTARRELAEKIANIMSKKMFVSLRVKPDGIYLATDKTNTFARTTTASVRDIETGIYPDAQPGDKVVSADWEPWYGITPLRKKNKPIRRAE